MRTDDSVGISQWKPEDSVSVLIASSCCAYREETAEERRYLASFDRGSSLQIVGVNSEAFFFWR
jgi:hypothetical protein